MSTPAGRAVVAHPFRAVHGLPFASVGHHFYLYAFGRCHIAVVAVVHPETYGRMVERRNADFGEENDVWMPGFSPMLWNVANPLSPFWSAVDGFVPLS